MFKSTKIPPFFKIEVARKVQRKLSERIIKHDANFSSLQRIAGIDVGYVGDLAVGVAVLLDYPSLKKIKHVISVTKVVFPYIPTLLSFRELKPAYLAFSHLHPSPDVVLVDAHGFSHPFRLGFASHLGVVIKKPTIGVAKKILIGRIGEWKNNWAPIIDHGEVVGAAVRTRKGSKPVYVSIGNMISLETAIKIVLKTTKKGYRIPEPTREAHIICSRVVRILKELFKLH